MTRPLTLTVALAAAAGLGTFAAQRAGAPSLPVVTVYKSPT
jgi:hypothetical protein